MVGCANGMSMPSRFKFGDGVLSRFNLKRKTRDKKLEAWRVS